GPNPIAAGTPLPSTVADSASSKGPFAGGALDQNKLADALKGNPLGNALSGKGSTSDTEHASQRAAAAAAQKAAQYKQGMPQGDQVSAWNKQLFEGII